MRAREVLRRRGPDVLLIGVLGALDLIAQFLVPAAPWRLAAGALGAYGVNLPLLLRRRRPVVVFVVVGAVVLARGAIGAPELTGAIPLLIAAHALGRYGARRHRPWVVWVVAGWGGAHAVIVSLMYSQHVQLADWLVVALAVGLAYLLGSNQHRFAAQVGSLRRSVHRQRERRSREVSSAVDAERERIALDLHDVVGNHLSALSVQTHVFEELLARRDPQAVLAANQIRESSRQAMTEMVRLQNLLRGIAASPEGVDCGPEGVTRLASAVRNAGNDVEFSVAELPSGMSPEVGAEGYLVLQEALTNVVKHASPTRVSIEVGVDEGADRLRLRVVNEPPHAARLPSPPGSGLGLVSMRARVTRLGGELHSSAEPDGGYVVDATIPLRSVS
ncbi:signal transduction histidine kinase [Crossiella equi]|uniref:histidine kinase n=1 Tax=Crossiella equi TaxID=130796 RepID=A0ABS5AK31_9PSEU|nr:histidine kinase [Crossiella equi]MBP2476766.1 signal transduction histidine kinase [Crossiella equi]